MGLCTPGFFKTLTPYPSKPVPLGWVWVVVGTGMGSASIPELPMTITKPNKPLSTKDLILQGESVANEHYSKGIEDMFKFPPDPPFGI